MKKIVIFFLLAFASISLSAQCINGTKSSPLYEVGSDYVYYLDSLGMEIVRIEYDLIFTTKDSYRYLYSDWEYLLVGFVDNGVKDFTLTLYEYDESEDLWFPVAYSEEAENGLTTLIYKPEETKQFRTVIEIKEFYEGYTAARYGLIYVHE